MKIVTAMIFVILALGARTDNLAQTLSHYITSSLPPSPPSSTATTIMSAYGIDPSSANNDMSTILSFMQDISFSQAPRACAAAWASVPGCNSHLTHFNVPNPWPGAWQGQASHALDAGFLLQNYNEHLGPGQRACAERMGRDLIDFVAQYGRGDVHESSLPRYSDSLVYYAAVEENDDKHEPRQWVRGTEAADLSRRGKLREHGLETPEILDALLLALNKFLQGPSK
jgi:hypothetical protein